MDDHSRAANNNGGAWSEEKQDPTWVKVIALLIWLLAGVVAFLPFALDTSPWDAVTLRVPGNQGNWWHVLVGAPFFLAYPMIWLRLRSLFSTQPSTAIGRRWIWSAIGLSIGGTMLVQVPFLLHLAGTSEWQRLSVLSLAFGIVVASSLILLCAAVTSFLPGHALLVLIRLIWPTQPCASSSIAGRPGPLVKIGLAGSMVIVWPMVFELVWLFRQTFRAERNRTTSLSVDCS